jgi:hypothetical protein
MSDLFDADIRQKETRRRQQHRPNARSYD